MRVQSKAEVLKNLDRELDRIIAHAQYQDAECMRSLGFDDSDIHRAQRERIPALNEFKQEVKKIVSVQAFGSVLIDGNNERH